MRGIMRRSSFDERITAYLLEPPRSVHHQIQHILHLQCLSMVPAFLLMKQPEAVLVLRSI